MAKDFVQTFESFRKAIEDEFTVHHANSLDKARDYYNKSYDLVIKILSDELEHGYSTKEQIIIAVLDVLNAHKKMRSDYVDILKNW